MTEAQLQARFRQLIKVIPGGPPVGTPGSNRAAGVIAALDLLAKEVKAGGNGKAATLSAVTLNVDAAVGNMYQLSPDLVAVVTALIAAGKKPVWILPDAGSAARTTILLAGRGVKNDGQLGSNNKLTSPGTDNTAALFAVRRELATLPFREQQPVTLVMPAGGVVTYADSRWADGYNDLVVELNGTTILTSYKGSDNKLGRSLFNGTLLQKEVAVYSGGMKYIDPVLIQDARAGSTTIRSVQAGAFSDATVWFPGAYVLPWAKEVVFRGEPVGARNFEDGTARVVSVSAEGSTLTLDKALAFDYLTSYPDYTATVGSPSGVGRITSLDNPAHRIPDRITVQNGTIIAAENCPEAFAMVARELVRLHKVKVIGNLTPTETPGAVEIDEADVDGEVEVDKLVARKGKVRITKSRLRKPVTNGGGSGGVEITDSQSDTTVQLCAPTVKVLRSKLGAKVFELYDVTTNTTITKDSDSALADYAGAQPVDYWIGQLELSASNNTSAYLNIATYQRHEVKEVDEQGRLVTRWDGSDNQDLFPFWKMAAPGTALFTESGSQGGRLLETIFEKPAGNAPGGIFRTSHTGPRFVVGQVVIWTPTLNVRDDGQHTIATPAHKARLYSEECLIWKGNQLPAGATTRTVTITKSDLAYNQFGAAYFRFRAKPTSVSFSTPAASPGRVKVTMLDKGETAAGTRNLCCFALSSTTTRTCSATASTGGMQGIDNGEPDQNQYLPASFGQFGYTCNVFVGNVELANAPEFSLTFTFDTY
jgi:hypothetical protein